MTPQERQLVDELFGRLAELEKTPRDPDAERAIAEGAQKAPNAIYALVQTALVQDEALRRANARIEELLAELDGPEQGAQPQPGFLDNMREAFGRRDARGSVPRVQPPAPPPPSGGWGGYSSEPADAARKPPPGAPPPPPYYDRPGFGPGFGAGGSFLGAAASTAAGVIGGSLLLDGIRSMFGHHGGLGGHGTNPLGTLADKGSPWGSGGGGDLARDAGIDHIGHGVLDTGHHPGGTDAGRSDEASAVADNSFGHGDDADFDSDEDAEFDGDDGGYGGDDSDFA